jgi:hypothetical protein
MRDRLALYLIKLARFLTSSGDVHDRLDEAEKMQGGFIQFQL